MADSLPKQFFIERLGVNKIISASNQLLHIASHIDTIEQVIIPHIKANKNVVLDRFW
jgi:thymidylate kinase